MRLKFEALSIYSTKEGSVKFSFDFQRLNIF